MYELICPSCRQPTRSPFVRIDAVATCPHCQQRYQIKPAHVHRAPVVAALSPDEADPLLHGVGHQELANLRDSGSAVADSRATNASNVASGVGTASAAAAPAASGALSPTDALLAAQSARRSNPPSAGVASAAVVAAAPTRAQPKLKATERNPVTVLMFVAVILVVLIAASGLGWLFTHRSHESGNLSPSNLPLLDPTTPKISADLQLPTLWRTVSLPANTPEAPGPVQLSEEGWILGGSSIAFGAKVTTVSIDPFSLATVKLWLVDGNNRRYSTAEIPVVLPSRKSPVQIKITVPQELYDRHSRVETLVILGPKLEESVRLETQDLQIIGSLKSNAIRLRIRNPSTQNVNWLFGVLRALDDRGRIVCQWRLQSSRDLNANQVQEAIIEAPLDAGVNIAHWETEFAGLFVNPAAANMSDAPANPVTEQR